MNHIVIYLHNENLRYDTPKQSGSALLASDHGIVISMIRVAERFADFSSHQSTFVHGTVSLIRGD